MKYDVMVIDAGFDVGLGVALKAATSGREGINPTLLKVEYFRAGGIRPPWKERKRYDFKNSCSYRRIKNS